MTEKRWMKKRAKFWRIRVRGKSPSELKEHHKKCCRCRRKVLKTWDVDGLRMCLYCLVWWRKNVTLRMRNGIKVDWIVDKKKLDIKVRLYIESLQNQLTLEAFGSDAI